MHDERERRNGRDEREYPIGRGPTCEVGGSKFRKLRTLPRPARPASLACLARLALLLYTSFEIAQIGGQPMQRHHDSIDDARIADNLRRTIELTELGLALRQSVLQQEKPDAMP